MNIQLSDIRADIVRSVTEALREDVGSGDITAELIPVDQRRDGELINAGNSIASLCGNSRTLLTGERTALNYLQLLSGVATKAYRYAQVLGESKIRLLDTRKTIPGLRSAQKYAVATGGCHNHRIGLFDAYLIKENHIAACGSITAAVQRAQRLNPDKVVEVEVESLEELREALACKANIVMLDNFSQHMLEQVQTLDKGACKYEISGNLTIENIAQMAGYNIDYISFGALTKHVEAVDLSFRVIKEQ